MLLGTEVGLGADDIVFDGNPAPPTERDTAASSQLFDPFYCGTVAHLRKC